MKTLYLHIGTPKTATTAIQLLCQKNQDVLSRHGYYFPMFDYVFPNVRKARNAHFLLGKNYQGEGPKDFTKDDKVFQEGFAQIYEAFEQYDNVILSDEGMWNFGFKFGERYWNKIQKELEKNIFIIKVIVYLRRQDDFVYSWWNQVVKEGIRKVSVITWEEMVNGLPVVQLDYYEKLEKIAKIVGKENVIVRKFDRSQFVGKTIQADFLNAIGLELSDEYKISEDIANASLTKNYNEIKRILNTLPELDSNGNKLFQELFTEFSKQPGDDKKYSMLSAQEMKEFMAEYEEGNRRIAQEYLGESGKLFDENYQVEEVWSPVNPEMIQDIVRFFGTTTLLTMKKNKELEHQISTLRYKINHPWSTIGNRIKNKIKNLWKKIQ